MKRFLLAIALGLLLLATVCISFVVAVRIWQEERAEVSVLTDETGTGEIVEQQKVVTPTLIQGSEGTVTKWCITPLEGTGSNIIKPCVWTNDHDEKVRVWTRDQLLERCTGKELRYEECGSGVWMWCDGTKKTACQRIVP